VRARAGTIITFQITCTCLKTEISYFRWVEYYPKPDFNERLIERHLYFTQLFIRKPMS